jgi:hypothetical protein
MWRRADILSDISEERIASIYSYLLTLVHRSWISYTLKMEVIRSSETSVNKISTRPHIPEDGILHSHRRENLKSYNIKICSRYGIFVYNIVYSGRWLSLIRWNMSPPSSY